MNIEIYGDEKLLVVAPHPDDESIGCGGLLNKFRGHCDVLLVTTGLLDKPDNKELVQIRQAEFMSASKVCGVDKTFLFQIPAQQIKNNFEKFLSIDYSQYKYIFVPNRYEYIQDHVDTYFSVRKALSKKRISTNLIEYEIWTTIRFPNIYLEISDVKDKKIEAISRHKTQIDELDFVKFSMGLNTYRGLSKGYECAEAYFCESEKKRERIRAIKRRAKKAIKK